MQGVLGRAFSGGKSTLLISLKMMSFLGLIWGIKPVPQRIYDTHKSHQLNLKINTSKIQREES